MSLRAGMIISEQISLQPTKSSVSRDRLVVRTLRCGRSNPGSNPGHGMDKFFFLSKQIIIVSKIASAGNRTRINCLEGSYADHYTTDAVQLLG